MLLGFMAHKEMSVNMCFLSAALSHTCFHHVKGHYTKDIYKCPDEHFKPNCNLNLTLL